MLIDMVNNMVILINGATINGQRCKKVASNVKADKIYVLQLKTMRLESLDITYIFYLDMLNV